MPDIRTKHAGVAALLALALLGGCVPMLAADAAAVAGSGKGASDHALDAMTGKDCRILEGLTRDDRAVCEEPGSPATAGDFKGLRRP